MKTYRTYQYPRGKNRGGCQDGEICSTISKSIWEHNYLLVEIVNYEQADKDRQPVRREQRDRLRREHLGYRGDLACPDNNGGGQPRTDNSGDSAIRGEFTWKGKHLDPWSGFQWNTSPAFSNPSLKDLSKTLRCDDTMCVMEIVRYERAEADNSRKL